ncbi:MAG TPA: LuxR C-terminal-related transcriptional regulator [Rubrobacteraceae bacterium]|nr:LuxR C-terminal-related transcriptional regulator [Rubrobacteraceae bacterium]
MARHTPYVEDGVLHVHERPGVPRVVVGSPSWVGWLTDPSSRSFSFRGPSATYTARKERRARGGEYWVAYRRHGGRLHKAYMGKAEDLTLEKLHEAAAALGNGDEEASNSAAPADAGAAESGRADRAEMEVPTPADARMGKRTRRRPRGDTLLSTKLSIPPARPYLVRRPRLSERLRKGMGCKLTLVSAPAGFGKTTLLGTWASDFAGRGSVAWLSLDAADNDPARFWRYFVTAVDRLRPGSGEVALASLGSPQAPPIEAILASLLNELAELDADAVLVLDDYHLIESHAIHEGLIFLLEHLPSRTHLIVSTRADPPLPLPRLRARGEMNELREADLRFAPEEAAVFLNEAMGLELSVGDIAELETRTEGWVAGLQMAAMAMRDRADVPGFIEAFTGSHRHVLDYLVEEVLDRQPEGVRSFLLESSILGLMCAPLCDAVTERTDGQAMLERLEHANLFVVPLDDERRWYRYHHLFADVLRHHLRRTRPNLVLELHRRASGWYEQEGLLDEAIEHAMAAHEPEGAARLIEGSAAEVLARGEVSRLAGWVEALPEGLSRSRPGLCVAHAWALFLTGRLEDAEGRARDAEHADNAGAHSGSVAALQANLLRVRGDVPGAIELSRKSLELLPEDDFAVRGAVSFNLGGAYWMAGDLEAAKEAFAGASAASLRAGNTYVALLSVRARAEIEKTGGHLHRAADIYQDALRIAETQPSPAAGLAHVGMGEVLYEWNDLDGAMHHLTKSIDLGKRSGSFDILFPARAALAVVRQTMGDAPGALEVMQEGEQAARAVELPAQMLDRLAAFGARLRLAQGDMATAARLLEERGIGADDAVNIQNELEHLVLSRVLLAQNEVDAASDLLERLRDAAESAGRMDTAVKALVLQALASEVQNDESGTLTALERALELAEPEGYVRTFLDEGAPMAALLRRSVAKGISPGYARRLIGAFGSPAEGLPAGSPSEHLSERELEVLRLIASGMSNAEVSRALFVSLATVKKHINNIYRKLGTHNRTGAVARARQSNLL